MTLCAPPSLGLKTSVQAGLKPGSDRTFRLVQTGSDCLFAHTPPYPPDRLKRSEGIGPLTLLRCAGSRTNRTARRPGHASYERL
jgi:hypothetical protein